MTRPPMRETTFGKLLRAWRQDRRLSQDGLAKLLVPRIHPSTVCCWERGSRKPSRRYLPQIVELTSIAPEIVRGLAPEESHP